MHLKITLHAVGRALKNKTVV